MTLLLAKIYFIIRLSNQQDSPLEGYLKFYIIQPNLLRLIRLFRISQPLRPFKFAKGIRKLLYALIISLPASFNIGILLVLIMFIYSIIGMNFFLNNKLIFTLTETQSFQTFGKSMITLFRISTGAGNYFYTKFTFGTETLKHELIV